jgi:hypothetical protein
MPMKRDVAMSKKRPNEIVERDEREEMINCEEQSTNLRFREEFRPHS